MKSDAIIGAVQGVTKKWSKQRKKEERVASARMNRRYVMIRTHQVTLKEAALNIMKTAYLKASANGKLPALARQIMYAARPHIQRTADREIGKGFDQYFTQTLLPDYMMDHPSETANWNVVFDARGHFHEPHTKIEIPLGTLRVREYLAGVHRHRVKSSGGGLKVDVRETRYPTFGPKHRYGAILFIEKEGFMPLFKAARLAERYDLAIMSTKGMSVTASRNLVDTLCGDHSIPLLTLHDFDKAGFSIVGTLQRNTRRYSFRHKINLIDLGLRMGDIAGLETEDVYTQSPIKARLNLRENGATAEEIDFLLTQRVELNAFASDTFLEWIEGKLKEHGVSKVIPNEACLARAYRRAKERAFVQQKIDAALAEAGEIGKVEIPDTLRAEVKDRLSKNPAATWDSVIRDLAEQNFEDGDDDE
jgi:hypothetical protein